MPYGNFFSPWPSPVNFFLTLLLHGDMRKEETGPWLSFSFCALPLEIAMHFLIKQASCLNDRAAPAR